MEFLKIKIIDFLLKIIKSIGTKLWEYRKEYNDNEVIRSVGDGSQFDMKNNKNGGMINNLLIHDQDIIDKRWSECEKCEFLTKGEKLGKSYHRCSQCGCFMKIDDVHIKTRVASVACPVGKWDRENNLLKGHAINGSKPMVVNKPAHINPVPQSVEK